MDPVAAVEVILERPRWRGLIHRVAAPTLLVAFVVLAARTPTRHGDRLAIVVYALGVTTMFAVSAVYHSGRLSPATTRVFQRIDHGTILLAIAGTYTAVTALAVTGRARAVLLTAVWIAAAVAAFIQVFRINAPRILGAIGYLVVGWFAAFDLPAYLRGTTNAEFAWIVAGGLAYSVGAVVYARKRPNPNPAVFGFHEVFHALTVVGATAHFVAVALMVSAL